MKAVRIHQHGGPEVLKIDEIPVPQCKENDVLVQLKASSLNHLDIWLRQGFPAWKIKLACFRLRMSGAMGAMWLRRPLFILPVKNMK